MEVISNRFITLKNHIDGFPHESEFELKSETLSLNVKPGCDEIIVKNLFLSIDPYQINRMKTSSSSHKHSFVPAIIPGKGIDGHGVGEVVASGNPQFQKGDLVSAALNWADYTVVTPSQNMLLMKLDHHLEFPLSYYVGIFGCNGVTAYAGLFEVGKAKKGEKVFVSAASGSVGSLVGQLAKLHGCYVVGCASTDQKVTLLKEKLGFDEAFNYKEENDLKFTLKRCFPDGIDVYFDNVGGEMLEAAIGNMNPFGRVVICGVISEYTNSEKRASSPNMVDVLYKRITISGFLAGDYMNIIPKFKAMAAEYLRSGEIQVLEDVSNGVESIPSAFVGLFQSDNIGKKVVKIET